MGYSLFPAGFNRGLAVRNIPVAPAHSGQVFYVGNGVALAPNEKTASDTANKGGFLDPFATLDFAVGQCSAGRGDIIYIKPGYSQSMTGADGVDVDVADVSIIGLGKGTRRAKFVYDNSAGEFVIGAVNVYIENLWFVPSVTGITKAIDVESGSTGFTIVGCRFGDAETAGTDEFNASIIVAATTTDGKIYNNYFNMGEAGAVAAITLTGAASRTEIVGNTILGDYSTACINSITTLQSDLIILGNIMVNGVTSGLNTEPTIELLTGSSGVIANNYSACNVATLAAHQVNDTAANFQNYFTEDRGSGNTAAATAVSVVASADD
jgi:hypothetical protein